MKRTLIAVCLAIALQARAAKPAATNAVDAVRIEKGNGRAVEHRPDRITLKGKDKKGAEVTERDFPLMFSNNRIALKKRK